jgi:hypothetical protein
VIWQLSNNRFGSRPNTAAERQKKADVAENPKVFDHVGLLVNEPPANPGCSLFSHPTRSSSGRHAINSTPAPLTTVFYSAREGTQAAHRWNPAFGIL